MSIFKTLLRTEIFIVDGIHANAFMEVHSTVGINHWVIVNMEK